MAYSQVGIVNLALGRIGSQLIASIDENSDQAIKAKAVWDYIRDEVLEAKPWRFAKYRKALARNTTAPASRYLYAYDLPADFIRMADDYPLDPKVYSASLIYGTTVLSNNSIFYQDYTYPYIIESLEDGTECLFTDYDNSTYNLYLTYIRRIIDPQKYTARFVNAFACRLGAELSTSLTRSPEIFKNMITLYAMALKQADELNQSLDFVLNEAGDTSWETAGR